MGILNFFGIKKAEKNKEEASLFFHEDDYCQIELLPIESLSFVMTEIDIIYKKYEKNDGNGFSTIHIRDESKLPLFQRGVKVSELKEIVEQFRLKKADKVLTGYGQSYREYCEDTCGYGEGYSALYFDFSDDIVKNVWFTNICYSEQSIDFIECLHQIGLRWNLLLVDWGPCVYFELKDKEAVKKYITGEIFKD